MVAAIGGRRRPEGGGPGVFDFRVHAKDVFRRDGGLREQSLAYHPVVAFGIVGRYVAFVAEEEIDFFPGNLGHSRQQGIKILGSGSAGECDGELASGLDRVLRRGEEFLGSGLKERRGIREGVNFSRHT